MILFIKDFSFVNIKKKLMLLFTLNVADIMLTLLLLHMGAVQEANPVMALFIDKPWLSLSVKIILPLLVLWLLQRRMQTATPLQLKKSNIAISAILMAYAGINILHLTWLVWFLLIRF